MTSITYGHAVRTGHLLEPPGLFRAQGGGAVKKEPRIGWWVADIANLLSISWAVIGHVCLLFVNHGRTEVTADSAAFIGQIGLCMGFLALAWLLIGLVFATSARVGRGTSNEAIAYVVLLVIASAGVVHVLMNAPS